MNSDNTCYLLGLYTKGKISDLYLKDPAPCLPPGSVNKE